MAMRRGGWGAGCAAMLAGWLGIACHSGSGPSEAHAGTVTVLDSAGLVDTVDALPGREFVLSILEPNGKGINGADVFLHLSSQVTADSSRLFWPAYPVYGVRTSLDTITAFVNDAGLVRFRFQRNQDAGTFPLVIRIPQIDYADTFNFIVQPGAAETLAVIPSDTALYRGASVQLRAAVLDRYGNPRTDPVTYSALGTGLQVTPSGRVTAGSAFARDSIKASGTIGGATATATGYLSIVPSGELAVAYHGVNSTNVAMVGLDGSGLVQILNVPNGETTLNAVGWTPDGAWILFRDVAGFHRVSVTAPHLREPFGAAAPGHSAPIDGELSRNGQLLVTSQVRQFGNAEVFAHHGNGTNPRLLTPPLSFPQPYSLAWRPSPSPDGTRVAVISDDLNGGLRVVDASTGTPEPWVTWAQRPRWSPLGDLIAFTTPGNGPLKVIHPDGSGERVVSPPGMAYREYLLSWSTDGQWLLAMDTSQHLHLVSVVTELSLPLGYSARMWDAAIRP